MKNEQNKDWSQSAACAAHLLARDVNTRLFYNIHRIPQLYLFTVYMDVCLQSDSLCVCLLYDVSILSYTFCWQFEVHAVCYHWSIEIDDDNVTVLVTKYTSVSILIHANALTLITLKHMHTNTHKQTRTRTVKKIPIEFALNFVAAVSMCVCIRVYMHGWMLGTCVCVAQHLQSSVSTWFVCFGYCQLLFWFLSRCFWTTLSLILSARVIFFPTIFSWFFAPPFSERCGRLKISSSWFWILLCVNKFFLFKSALKLCFVY